MNNLNKFDSLERQAHNEAIGASRYEDARDILFTAMRRALLSNGVTSVESCGVATNEDGTKSFLFSIKVNEMITYGQLKELDRNGAKFSVVKPERNGLLGLMIWVSL